MVDFNNETTVATPAIDIVRVEVLERRYNVGEALETVLKLTNPDVRDTKMIGSRLKIFYYLIEETIKRSIETDDKEKLEELMNSEEIDDLIQAYRYINKILDRIGFSKIDNRRNYDKKNIELDNSAFGL